MQRLHWQRRGGGRVPDSGGLPGFLNRYVSVRGAMEQVHRYHQEATLLTTASCSFSISWCRSDAVMGRGCLSGPVPASWLAE